MICPFAHALVLSFIEGKCKKRLPRFFNLPSNTGVIHLPEQVEPSTARRHAMGANYTAVVQQDGERWIGWVEEIPGVNSQGQTRDELLENLRDALEEALEMNRAEARAAATGPFEEVSIPT
jgi:predicted RNase H-like HicB family nuclease